MDMLFAQGGPCDGARELRDWLHPSSLCGVCTTPAEPMFA